MISLLNFIIITLEIRLLNIFVLLASLNVLPPWAKIIEILVSVVNAFNSVRILVDNLKKWNNMKTQILYLINKAKLVWNVGGLKQTRW